MRRFLKYIFRIVLGAATGIAVWFILHILADNLFIFALPNYAAEKELVDSGLNGKNMGYEPSSNYLLITLSFRAIITFIAGFAAAFISRKKFLPPYLMALSLAGLGVIGFYTTPLNYPIWYEVLAILMLVPLAMLGGKLRAK